MKARLTSLLLLLAVAASGNVPRVQVRVPSVTGGQAGLAAPALLLPQFSNLSAPALAAPAPQLSPAFAAAPSAALLVSPLAPVAAPRAALAAATPAPALAPSGLLTLSAPPMSAPQQGARAAVISTLREHGALAGKVAEGGDASAAEANFRRAAGLGETAEAHEGASAVSVPADSPRWGALGKLNPFGGKGGPVHDHKKWKPAKNDPLYDALMRQLTLDSRGSEREAQGLERMVRRMLESPTARKYAQQFIDEGITGVVKFDEVEGSKVYEFERRKIFYAPRAFTDWKDGKAVVRMNRDYLDSDEEYFFEDAPPTLAHELLGHGLWYGRMAKHALQEGFHVHENNETNAKLVGWLASWELNRRHHDTYAYEYLQRNLKLRQPYYSVTYSDADLKDPLAALRARLEQLPQLRAAYAQGLANTRSWPPIVDHFIFHHAIDESRFAKLREDLAGREAALQNELATLDHIEQSVRATIEYYESEAGKPGLDYLKFMGSYQQFRTLQADVDAMTAELRQRMTSEEARPGPAPLPWPEGQITWEQFQEMFQRDARENPSHWVQK
jgi:hypothetical protein